MTRKIYTVRINEDLPTDINLWYRFETGKEYTTQLTVHENANGNLVPVFKLSVSPFFHVYPNHCTIIKEQLVGNE
jgi:hypothetical protein